MQKKITLITLLVAVLLLISFSLLHAQKVEYKDGVKIIHNEEPLRGENPKVGLEFVRKIGGFEAEDENFQFYYPSDILRDNTGSYYILDDGTHGIKKFNSCLNYIATFGRKGKGPGEFESPFSFDIFNDSLIYTFDAGNNRIQIYSITGEASGSFRIKLSLIRSLRFLKSGNLVLNAFIFQPLKKHFFIVNTNGTILKEFGKTITHKIRQIASNINNAAITVDQSDNIYAAYDHRNRIEKYSPEGQLLYVIDRPLNYKIDHKMGKPVNNRRETEMTFISREIGIDGKGRIWVAVFKKQPEEKDLDKDNYETDMFELEIYSSEGLLLGKLPLKYMFYMMRIFTDRIYFIDSDRAMCIYEYKIIER